MIKEAKALFPRVEKTSEQGEKPSIRKDNKKDNLVEMSEFTRIEIRAGKIMEAEAVKKSNKLVLLKVDVGKPIQIVAGIGQAYRVDDLVGKYIGVVTNLKPARLMGLMSEGMLLATDSEGGNLTLLSFDEAPKIGARIR
jgi:methionyl-tRNA synthetase